MQNKFYGVVSPEEYKDALINSLRRENNIFKQKVAELCAKFAELEAEKKGHPYPDEKPEENQRVLVQHEDNSCDIAKYSEGVFGDDEECFRVFSTVVCWWKLPEVN